jgi:hypothetical protein
LGCGALGNRVWSFLQLDCLFVHVSTSVVNDCHRISHVAIGAFGGFQNSAALNSNDDAVVAIYTFKVRFGQIWNNGACSDHHSLNRNKLVDV